ncbi:MAG: aspartate kinase [Candidatus Eremiobacteraeota bacterium]|nr:aspartate kinase [Candidatus Eremiobacteraeota bacterium]
MKGAKATSTIRVLKFGGSSLATPALRNEAAARVIEHARNGDRVVVVVSAMGRSPNPYATDTLLALVPQAQAGPNCDLLLATGEIISAAVFAELLESRALPARALTGSQAGIVTDATHGNARVLSVDPRPLIALLESGVAPVVCGFQGATEDGAVATLGRGGSDLTAVAIAKALDGAALDIYTDVDGVMTADPKRVPQAKTISALTFEEVTELSEHGATVMHDKAADLARVSQLSYSVRNLHSGAGTSIGARQTHEPAGPVTGVATSFGYTFMHLVPEAAVLPGGWEQEAFRTLSDGGISIDCVNVNSAGLFFIVRDDDYDSAYKRLEPLPLAARTRRNCAKISVVGAGMRGTPGVMYRCVRALSAAGVPIIHSTDSNITISLLVPGAQAAAAEQALHEHFNLGK